MRFQSFIDVMMVICLESNISLDASIVRAVCCWMYCQVCAFAFAFCGCLDGWGGLHRMLDHSLCSMHETSFSWSLGLSRALTPGVRTWTHKQCSGKKPSDAKHCKNFQQTNRLKRSNQFLATSNAISNTKVLSRQKG